MKVHQIFFKNTLRNFCYLIVFDDGAIYCIDPFNASEVLDLLGGGRSIKAIVNTHDHCDHYSGNKDLLSVHDCPVFAHVKADVPGKTHGLRDGEVLHEHAGWSLEALYTPGHTLSHLCLMVRKGGVPHSLFTGDCFFNAGVGNCHNGGDPKVLYKTICEIFSTFPDDLLIYPGHEYLKRNLEFTLSIEEKNADAMKFLHEAGQVDVNEVFFINDMRIERKINLFLRLQEKDIKKSLNMSAADDESVFIRLRELRNKW